VPPLSFADGGFDRGGVAEHANERLDRIGRGVTKVAHPACCTYSRDRIGGGKIRDQLANAAWLRGRSEGVTAGRRQRQERDQRG
jgi:hypothetical protein